MADSLRGGGTGWRFGTGCPPGRLADDAGRARPRLGFRQPGRDGTGDGPVACTGIRRRGQVSGGEGGFNLAQPPEVRQYLRREIDERGNRPIACFLPGPAQRLAHLPAGDGEWRMASGSSLLATRCSYGRPAGRPSHSPLAPSITSTSQP